jgi:hypothetical protein
MVISFAPISLLMVMEP